MKKQKVRVYCAGPLFNDKERLEMQEIASALEAEGLETFLPQRDGLEMSRCVDLLLEKGFMRGEASEILSEAIFALDVYQVLEGCNMLIANLNGRVPDEGTVAEAAMAWARGKPVVGFKADSRTLIGGADNPLVAGLFRFRLCQTISELANVAAEAGSIVDKNVCSAARENEISAHNDLGSEIWRLLCSDGDVAGIVELVLTRKGKLVARE